MKRTFRTKCRQADPLSMAMAVVTASAISATVNALDERKAKRRVPEPTKSGSTKIKTVEDAVAVAFGALAILSGPVLLGVGGYTKNSTMFGIGVILTAPALLLL